MRNAFLIIATAITLGSCNSGNDRYTPTSDGCIIDQKTGEVWYIDYQYNRYNIPFAMVYNLKDGTVEEKDLKWLPDINANKGGEAVEEVEVVEEPAE